jgi:hypothetical protein
MHGQKKRPRKKERVAISRLPDGPEDNPALCIRYCRELSGKVESKIAPKRKFSGAIGLLTEKLEYYFGGHQPISQGLKAQNHQLKASLSSLTGTV